MQSENKCCTLGFKKGVFCSLMLSPIGMNAHFVCDFYDVSMCDIGVTSKTLAWSVHNSPRSRRRQRPQPSLSFQVEVSR